jgi:hypothetical protein
MYAQEKVHVSLDHADLEDVSTLLPGYRSKTTAQETGQAGIDPRLSVVSRPDNVHIDSVIHCGNMARAVPLSVIIPAQDVP